MWEYVSKKSKTDWPHQLPFHFTISSHYVCCWGYRYYHKWTILLIYWHWCTQLIKKNLLFMPWCSLEVLLFMFRLYHVHDQPLYPRNSFVWSSGMVFNHNMAGLWGVLLYTGRQILFEVKCSILRSLKNEKMIEKIKRGFLGCKQEFVACCECKRP